MSPPQQLLEEQLKPFVLLGGLDAAELWPTIYLALLTWGLLIFAPRWKWTPALSLIAPILNAAVYAGSIFSLMSDPESETYTTMTLETIVKMFQDPNIVFIGWVHYIVFDALVGRVIAFDACERGATTLVHAVFVVPCLVFTFLLGPVGFLAYMVAREIILPHRKKEIIKAKVF